MPTIDFQNALMIAKLFAKQAMAVQTFRQNNFKQLSNIQRSGCLSTEQHLRDTSNDFLALATTFILDDIAGSVSQLSGVSTEITNELQRLGEIDRGLAIIGIALQLAVGFASENPGAIASALSSAASAFAPVAAAAAPSSTRPAL